MKVFGRFGLLVSLVCLLAPIAHADGAPADLAGPVPSASQVVPLAPPGSLPPPATPSPAVAVYPSIAHPPLRVSRFSAGFASMYADAGMQRIMAAHDQDGRFAVLNLQNGSVRDLPTGPVSGIAVDAPGNKIFVAGDGQTVVVLDRRSLERIDEILLNGHAAAMALDTDDYRLFVDHDGSPSLWMIDAKTHEILGTIRLDGSPSFIAYDSADKAMLQNIESDNRLERIDPNAGAVTASWPTAPATSPTGLAVDPADFLAFVAGANGVLVAMDTRTGAVLGSAPIAPGAGQIAFDPVSHMVFCASGSAGTVSVVHVTPAGACAFVGQIATHVGASSIALSGEASSLDVWVCYPAAGGSYMQCFSVAR